ncbi:MAG: hypothetical protein AAGF89_16210 [Bacteroidota bacterium]
MLFSLFVYLLSLVLRGKKPDVEFCEQVKKYLRNIVLILVGGFLVSCGAIKSGLTQIEDKADNIGKEAAAGFVAGLDTTQVDSLVARLVAEAGNSFNAQLDTLSLDELEQEVSATINTILKDNLDELSLFLRDTSNLIPLETKIDLFVNRLASQLDASLQGAIPGALSGRNQQIVLQLRDDFLGEEFRLLMSSAVNQGVGDLAKSEELDSLLSKLSVFVEETSDKVNETTDGISDTVKAVAIGIGGLLLALSLLFFTLWFRKRSQAREQRELLVNLTKAIDAIPSQREYDRTIDYLQKETSLAHKQEQKVLLDQVLTEAGGTYPEKKRYNDYARRMIDRLKTYDQDGSLRQQLLTDTEDDDFQEYVMNGSS